MRIFQRGFSLVSAIFLLVVLSFLGVAMTTLSTTQNQSAALDVMGARAYQAARAGIEWAAYFVNMTPQGTPWAGCVMGVQPVVLAGDLAPFTVTVDCTATSYVESGATIWIYAVTARANTGGGANNNPDYVERAIAVKLGK
jgi:MSHA biogenesis protein MshP